MRVLITPFPWVPHYYPIVPFAWACQMAGHEVRIAAAPTITDVITRTGLPAVPVGPDPAEAFRRSGVTFTPPKGSRHSRKDSGPREPWPADWPAHPERLSEEQRAYFRKIGLFASVMADAQLDELVAFGRDWRADVIVHDGTQFAGPVAAAALGIPNVRYLLGYPGQLRVDTCYGDELVPEFAQLFERFGVAPRAEPTAWLDPSPPGVQYPWAADANVLAMRYVPYNGPGELPAWLHRPPARPRVCMTWGFTTAEWEGPAMLDFVRQTIDAITGLDVELVLVLSETLRDLLGEQPDGVRVAVGLPMNALLPTCSAVVHHAGPGTTMAAVAAGVPQLMITNHPHNAAIASRVAATGAGRHLLLEDVPTGPEATRAEVAALLGTPSYREGAERLRRENARQPAPSDVVSALEGLAA
ncbi:nucleotide disphospho-sugar-binding domain-containing protein [Streptomyces roseoverticillatus]|uniref:Nucleotide disphospho-sugar-binding domain-containing protein n=1 Tax=Streptomyces roseoverticillatus TaxID=66429 RepID=A0ABV3IP41_9ACTN